MSDIDRTLNELHETCVNAGMPTKLHRKASEGGGMTVSDIKETVALLRLAANCFGTPTSR